MKVFKSAISLCEDKGCLVSIGGGEPTLHPNFWNMIKHSLSKDFECIWLATNGSKTEDSLALAKLAKSGAISVALSRDKYHGDIDEKVVRAFTRRELHSAMNNRDPKDCREIRTISFEINGGRCDFGVDDCPCSEIFVKPNGDIYFCGCSDSPLIGNVLKEGILPKYNEMLLDGEQCWKWIKEQEFDSEKLSIQLEGGIRI